MTLSWQQGVLGVALADLLEADRSARNVLMTLVTAARLESQPVTPDSLAALEPHADALAETQDRLPVAIANFYRALDDYLDE